MLCPISVCRLKQRTSITAHITPHRVRHILVSYIQQNPTTLAGVEDQVAHLMGHALRMWRVR